MLRVHICIHIPDPTFDRIVTQILPISLICKHFNENYWHDVEEDDDEEAWEDFHESLGG